MIRLAGLKPDKDIKKLEFTGLRPGEKLYEELLVDHSNNERTQNKKIFVEKQHLVEEQQLELEEIFKNFEHATNDEVKHMVSHVIKTYKVNGKDAN